MSKDNPVVAVDFKCPLCKHRQRLAAPRRADDPFFDMTGKWCNCSSGYQPVVCERRFVRRDEE